MDVQQQGCVSATIADVPDEVILLVYGLLDFRDISRVSTVSKRFHNLTRDLVLWKLLFFRKHLAYPDNTTPSPEIMRSSSVTWRGKDYRTLCYDKYQALQKWKVREHTTYYVVVGKRALQDMRFQFDTSKIVYGGASAAGYVMVWTGPKMTSAFNVGHDVFQLRFHKNILVTSARHQADSVRVWDMGDWSSLPARKLVHTFHGGEHGVEYLAFNGKELITGGCTSDIHVYDIEAGSEIITIKNLQPRITAFHASFDGSGSILTGGGNGSILLYDLRTGDVVKQFKGHTGRISCLQFDEATVITAEDKIIKRYDLASEECTHSVNIAMKLGNSNSLESVLWDSPAVTCLQFDKHKLIMGFNEGPLALWNPRDLSFIRAIDSEEDTQRIPKSCQAIQFTDKLLMAVSQRGDVSSIKAWKVNN